MNKPHHRVRSLFESPQHFGATILRYAFGIFFVLVAVKKFRNFDGFLDSMVLNPENLITQEIPNFLLYIYGYLIPFVELAAGLSLLFNVFTHFGFTVVAFTYISFVFGQMYNGNTSKIGTEYIPSLLAVIAAYWLHDIDHQKRVKK